MKKLGRKIVNCSQCNKFKLHFGLGMCSSCLRHHKRQTRPLFYLGTQYSEIKRRCTTKNYGTRYYNGKQFCSKEEYINRFINDEIFLNQYRLWQESGFKRSEAPSIDRIDNNKGYLLDNLQILPLKINSRKDWQQKTELYLNGELFKTFSSQLACSKYLRICQSELSLIVNGIRKNKTKYVIKRYV